MITPKDIKIKALRKYKDFLCFEIDSLFEGADNFFPLVIQGNTGSVNDELLQRQKELQLLINGSKPKSKSGYCLDTGITCSRKNGEQTYISRIYFETKEDYLAYIDEESSYNRFHKALNTIRANNLLKNDDFKIWAKNHTRELCENKNDCRFWEDICQCVNWLNKNQDSNLFIREIPLSIHTKFIENNESLIKSLSNKADSPEPFEQTFGLKEKQSYVRFRILDEAIKLKLESNDIKECSIALEDFKRLNDNFISQIKNVFIIENEMVYLTFPKIDDSICLYGGGYRVDTIKDVAWLESKHLYYFGDLDEHGFDILSSFRSLYPDVQSFCMSKSVWEDHQQFSVEGRKLKKNDAPENLTEEEKRTFEEIQSSLLNRLEQERISVAYIKDELKRIGL